MEVDRFVADVVKTGFGKIDFTKHHGLPNRQKNLPGIEAEDPIVNGIVRDGVVLQIANCLGCGVPISVAPNQERHCRDCQEWADGDGEDDEEVRR